MTDPPLLTQINLIVRDLDAALAFYRRLGVPAEADPGAFHAAVKLANGLLIEWDVQEFVPQWDAGWTGRIGGGPVLGFTLATRDAVEESYADLTGAGYHGHQPPYDAFWGARYAIVDDPDGYSVALMSPIDPARKAWPPTPPPGRP